MRGTEINISGRTNCGKSTLANTMAKNAILNGWKVAGNEPFRREFPYLTLDNGPLDGERQLPRTGGRSL